MRFIVDLDFRDRRQAAEGDGKWKEWLMRALSLFSSDRMLSNRQFCELSVLVESR